MSALSDREGATNGSAKTSRRKTSTGFPVVTLPEAAEIMQEAGKLGFEHSVEAFAGYMGHTTTNSGAFRQRLAALRSWGLITGRGDTVAITEVGQRLAVTGSEDDERRALREAFQNCEIFARLYGLLAKNQPLPIGNLAAKAVHDLGVAPRAKDKFVDSFAASAVSAGLAETVEDGTVLLLADDPGEGAAEQPSPDLRSPTRVETPTREHPREAPIIVKQRWPIEKGEIVLEIRSSERLPGAVFGSVGRVVEMLEELAEALSPMEVGSSSSQQGE